MEIRSIISAAISACIAFTGCSPIKTAKGVKDFAMREVSRVSLPSNSEIESSTLDISNKAFESILEENADSLHELFCPALKNEIGNEQIKQLFELISGKIVSHDDADRYGLGVHYQTDFRSQAVVRYDFANIKTDTSDTYSLSVVQCAETGQNGDLTGIHCISLYKGDMFKDGTKICDIGRVIEKYTPQKAPEKLQEIDEQGIVSSVLNEYYASNVLYYYNHDDKEAFVELFRKDYRETAAKTYDELKNFIDGRMVSYSCMHTEKDGGQYVYDHYESRSGCIEIYDIVDEKGEMYEIDMKVCYLDDKSPEKIGMNYFAVRHIEKEVDNDFKHQVISEIVIGNEKEEE